MMDIDEDLLEREPPSSISPEPETTHASPSLAGWEHPQLSTPAPPVPVETSDGEALQAHPSLPRKRSASSQTRGTQAPIKRKPLPVSATATRHSSHEHVSVDLAEHSRKGSWYSRSLPLSLDISVIPESAERLPVATSNHFAPSPLCSADSATSPDISTLSSSRSEASVTSEDLAGPESSNIPLHATNHATNPAVVQTFQALALALDREHQDAPVNTFASTSPELSPTYTGARSPESSAKRATLYNSTSAIVRKAAPTRLDLGNIDTAIRTTSSVPSTAADKPLPPVPTKSPASSKLALFFDWGKSIASLSDKGSLSPLPSPLFFSHAETNEHLFSAKQNTPSNTNEGKSIDYSLDAYLQTPPAIQEPTCQIGEMEDELKAISVELAASIRREMDLEDLVERLQDQVINPQAPGKRTSDYFSDSGYSSAKFSEFDHARDEIAQVQRRAEQEKARIRLEFGEKLQDERSRRRVLDQQIQELSRRASQIDIAAINSRDASGRIRELESSCEDLRRRLSEERQVKDNFEDLLTALKHELQDTSNERDNLRDEIVPQLRTRVEGLEAAATENSKLTYETTRLHQELRSLKSEIEELRDAQKEAPLPAPRISMALSRSASAASSYKKNRLTTLIRSNTVTRSTDSREALSERLKDVEAQRDALHNALKNLLERQEFQNRENEKKIKALENERERLLAASPKKAGYEKEVANLRAEINVLRRRAEEAIEQKWQVEKGLSGLKMDLDRAQEEIAMLRGFIEDKDVSTAVGLPLSSGRGDNSAGPVTSATLEQAYKDLQTSYVKALDRIRKLEAGTALDEKTQLAIQRLQQSLDSAVAERDLACAEAARLRTQRDEVQDAERVSLESECQLADQLSKSAARVEELAQQVRTQLANNASLRTRLTETVARGEADQRASTQRIAELQAELRQFEEKVIAAQTAAEERVARHEDELTALKDGHVSQLSRLAVGSPRSPRVFGLNSPVTPIMTTRSHGNFGLSPLPISPRPSSRQSSSTLDGGDTLAEQVVTLKSRVSELEAALALADKEMQEVVARMSTAQIDVLMLQEERETAVRETRRLQNILEEERAHLLEGRRETATGQP